MQFLLIFSSMQGLVLEVITINWLIILYIMTYASIFSARIVNIWNSLPNSIVDTSTANAFKAWLDKFWSHQAVKYDLTADLTGTGKQKPIRISYKVKKFDIQLDIWMQT